jgi:hypothetical protein
MQNVHSDGLIRQRGPAILAPGYGPLRAAPVRFRVHQITVGRGFATFLRAQRADYHFRLRRKGSILPIRSKTEFSATFIGNFLIRNESNHLAYLTTHTEWHPNDSGTTLNEVFADTAENLYRRRLFSVQIFSVTAWYFSSSNIQKRLQPGNPAY